MRPTARPARMRRRHWRLVASFQALVGLPLAVVIFYLWGMASDQYASVTGFAIRQEEGGNPTQFLGGLTQLTGVQTGSDGEILYEFILSQSLVREIQRTVGLVDHYSARFPADPVFALWPDPSIEDLERYWRRIVRVSYDPGTGLTELRVLAFDPEKARSIAQAIVGESQDMINALNERAREDAMRYARADLEQAVERLKSAREALTAFRTRTQIVDPEADIQGRMGVMNNLQQSLAEALIEYDLIRETTNASDPRVSQARRRIDVIRERIAEERDAFASVPETGAEGQDYPSLIAEYEGLVVDREFAEESYRAALAGLDVARAQAQRQSRYLATYVEPTLAEESAFPRRFTLAGLTGLLLLLTWAVLALVYYAVRDRA
ncbi:sugar transporter [Citreimonas salinaria]|uniref:sugar transporter n=1 Tax=Citreimonas salinaria TaxID=321339 RepID=UPI0015A643F3|nr:sugar transporter [Citreimonas salinaria]